MKTEEAGPENLMDEEIEPLELDWAQSPAKPTTFEDHVYILGSGCTEIAKGFIFKGGLLIADCPNLKAIRAKIEGELKVAGCPLLTRISTKTFDRLHLGPLVGMKELKGITITNKHRQEIGLWIIDMPNLQTVTGTVDGTVILDHCAVQNIDGIKVESHWKGRPAVEVANCPFLPRGLRRVRYTNPLGQRLLDRPTPEEEKTKTLHFDLIPWQTFAKNVEADPLWCRRLKKRTVILGGLEMPKGIKALSPWLIFTMNLVKGADVYLDGILVTTRVSVDFVECQVLTEIVGTYRCGLQAVGCPKLRSIKGRAAGTCAIAGIRVHQCPKLAKISQKVLRGSIYISGPTGLKKLTGLKIYGLECCAGGVRFQNCPDIEEIRGYFTEGPVLAGSGIRSLEGLRFPNPLTYCGNPRASKATIRTQCEGLPPNLPVECIPLSWKPEEVQGATPAMIESWEKRKALKEADGAHSP